MTEVLQKHVKIFEKQKYFLLSVEQCIIESEFYKQKNEVLSGMRRKFEKIIDDILWNSYGLDWKRPGK